MEYFSHLVFHTNAPHGHFSTFQRKETVAIVLNQMFGEDQRGKALHVCLHMIDLHHCRLVDTFIYVKKRF